jgi:ATP synthase protein I
MPHPDNQRDEARRRLDEGLSAFDAKRARGVAPTGEAGSMGEGYRLLGGLIGGVFGGFGLGWTFDYFAHTGPIGLVVGLLTGIVLSIVSAVRIASRTSAKGEAAAPTGGGVEDDDDD